MTNNNSKRFTIISPTMKECGYADTTAQAVEVKYSLNEKYTVEDYQIIDNQMSILKFEGKKYDSNKSMVGTLCNVFPNALLAIGNCIEFGTHKYPDPANWQKVEGAFTRYQDSIMRHYLKFLAGQERDSETNLLHLAHMAWNTLAVLELYLRGHIKDYEQELYR